MKSKANTYFAVGTILVFILLFLIFTWKLALIIVLTYLAFGAFSLAYQELKKEQKNI
jgi:ABC-type bacteriocin/lantibiotic exporter with double-glycine peptidase domain